MTPSKQTLTINSHRITYAMAGDPAAPPIIMLHGWLSYGGVWRQTFEAFQNQFYCIAPDLLGFGDSDKPAQAAYSIAAQAQSILELANALGCARFTLIGHSMGGQISLELASRLAPERVIKLVSVAGVVSGRLQPFIENVNSRS